MNHFTQYCLLGGKTLCKDSFFRDDHKKFLRLSIVACKSLPTGSPMPSRGFPFAIPRVSMCHLSGSHMPSSGFPCAIHRAPICHPSGFHLGARANVCFFCNRNIFLSVSLKLRNQQTKKLVLGMFVDMRPDL